MPELPEVETTVKKLKPLIKGKKILGRKILNLERKGKAILIHLSGEKILAFHQRMSGRILVVERSHRDKYIRRRFKLSDGKDLAFHDVRRFGVVWYGTAKKVLADNYFKTLGEDALTIEFQGIKELIKPPPTPSFVGMGGNPKIKAFLLDQKNLAGIGNIMADEILWYAKINPEKQISSLTDKEIKLLWSSMRAVINKSIKLGGSSMRDWLHPGGEKGGYFEKRYVYGREGEKCLRCESKILRKKIAGRSSYYCTRCQKN